MDYVKWLRTKVGHDRVILNGSVTVVLSEKGEILLQHRSDGRWGLPGGLMELGESCEDTARREAMEETGLTLGALRLLGVYSGANQLSRAQNGDEFYCVVTAYEAREYTGEPKVNDGEGVALGWFSPDSLPENMVGSHRRIIRDYYSEG